MSLSNNKVEYDFPVRSGEGWRGIALVGEAPGADEVRQGHPFVGRSGQLLNKMLIQAEIDRSQCLVANVFRFQPPGNKVDHFFISRRKAILENIEIEESYGKFGSSYCRAEFASEIANLAATLRQWRPAVIVSLGRTPLWALTGENGLMARVGVPQTCRLVPEIPVMPTFHPSFILRGNWGLQDQWLQHFLAANQYVR